ncbi:hypothetical protein D7D52_34700 [Nocardia yunnanensis]|uniref:Uncharacterized protein n=1 Tax=Nocardia yunnanensis TaxID=2382165 RepID=A0A386ZLF8_9NOCA|nr:hypothetical protein [Nocardia yunnanensis]AYF78123.1 hypothetical protein D7D52_34700 [Nocardia yunnanensis]
MITSLLAADQPSDAPFEQIASKFLGLVWALSGWVALAALLCGAAVFAYQKWTMQNSAGLGALGGVLALAGCGAMAANLINWALAGPTGEDTAGSDPSAPVTDAGPAAAPDFSWIWPVLGVAAAGGAMWAMIRAMRARSAARATRAAQLERWNQGVTVLNQVAAAIVEAETDPGTVLVRPLMLDLTDEVTADIHATYAKARALCPARVPDDDALITSFVQAAHAARTAFNRADVKARSKAAKQNKPLR